MADEISDVVEREEKDMEERKPGLLSGILHSGLAVGATWLSYGLVGFGGPLTGFGFAAGSAILNALNKNPEKESRGLTGVIKDYTAGTLAGIVGVSLFEAAEIIPNTDLLGKATRGAAALTVGNPIFTGAYLGTDKLVKHGPIKMWPEIEKNYVHVLKEVTKWLGIPLVLTINGYFGGYPGIVAADAGYRIVAGFAQKQDTETYEEESNLQPAMQPT